MFFKTKLIMGITLIVVFAMVSIIPIQSKTVSETKNWSENFDVQSIDKLLGWEFKGYKLGSSSYEATDSGFQINNNMLESAESTDMSFYQRALHNSSVAYGKWSFDWEPSVTENSYDVMEFLFTDNSAHPYDDVGKAYNPDTAYYAGYGLVINSGFGSYGYGTGQNIPAIWLVKYHNDTTPIPDVIQNHNFDYAIKGKHTIEISRDKEGNFIVNYDSNQVLNIKDTTYTSSEKFNYVSLQGNSSIDNIVVEDINSTSASTPFGSIEFILLGFTLLTFISVLKRKSNFN